MKAWLQLLRISNLPTVWSNTLFGVVAGGEAAALWVWVPGGPVSVFEAQLEWAWQLMLAMSCFYLGGMALNDVLDVVHDRMDAPHRPIVAGRISRRAAACACLILVTAGFVFLPYRSRSILITTVVLVLCIIAYDALHHRFPISRHLMGVCRGLVIVAASMSVDAVSLPLWLLVVGLPALILMIYTNVLTWLAARESDPENGPARRKVVLQLLAAMPLLDAAWLALMMHWPAACFCVACAGLTRVWHRFVSGT